MGLFGATNKIPDDVAEKIATSLFNKFNRSLEFNIDEDIERYDMLGEWEMKPFWHYGSGDEHYYFSVDKQITSEMEFYRTFVKGNGYISCDRFNCIHTVSKEAFLKVMDLIKQKFEAQGKHFICLLYYDKVYKRECFKPYAYMTLEEKLISRGEGKGKTSYCRFPKPDHQIFRSVPGRFGIVQNRPDLEVNAELQGITLLSEKQMLSCKQFITFQQKDKAWWLTDPVPGNEWCAKAIQPNELVNPHSVCFSEGISPAVTGVFEGFKRGDKVLFAGHKWTVIFENMILVDDFIGYGPFNYYLKDGNDYGTCRVKDFAEHWFEEHRNDPVYRAGR